MRWVLFFASLALLAQPDEDVISAHAQAAAAAMQNGSYASAEQQYRALVRLRPEMAEARVNLGVSCFLQKKYPEAIQAFESALKLNPDLANADLLAGISQFNLNRPAAASTHLARYVKARPDDFQGQYFLGLSYVSLERYQDAIRILQVAQNIEPRNVDVLYHLAQAYLEYAREDVSKRGSLAAAYQEAIERIAAIDPSSFRLAQLRAGAAELEGNKAEAIRQLVELLRNDPKTSGIHYTLGCLYVEARDYDKALSQFQAELLLERPWPRTWLQLGHVYVALEKPRDALPVLHHALEMDPAGGGLVWVDIAHAYRLLDEPEKSITAFGNAIRLGQRSAAIYYQLGLMQKKAGHDDAARQTLAISEKLRSEESARNDSRPR